jgi:hypothetical protein
MLAFPCTGRRTCAPRTAHAVNFGQGRALAPLALSAECVYRGSDVETTP